MTEPQNIYSGVFFDNGLHMTWEFGKNCSLPKGIKEGDEQHVCLLSVVVKQKIGIYGCKFKLNGKDVLEQPNSTPLHITLYTGKDADGNKIPPKEASVVLKDTNALIIGKLDFGQIASVSLYTNASNYMFDRWTGKWGYFKK